MNKSINGLKNRKVWLAKRLRMDKDPDRFEVVWDFLVEREIIEAWERGATTDEDVVDDAKDTIQRFRAWEGRSSSLGQKPQGREMVDIPVEPAEREMNMTGALRTYLAAHAARRTIVRRFRREYLPDGLLRRDEEISEFLSAELGVGVTVDAYLAYPEGKPNDSAPLLLDYTPPQRDTCGVYTDEELVHMRAREEQKQAEEMERDWKWHAFVSEDLLQRLAKWLVDKYPWASVEDAEVFLISGRPPRLVESLRASRDDANATYSITFSPWISEETVLRTYRAIQSDLHRAPGNKTVRVLQFVSEQADDEGCLPSWPTLLNRWNATNPNEAFSDRSALRRAHGRAVEALVPPYLPLT